MKVKVSREFGLHEREVLSQLILPGDLVHLGEHDELDARVPLHGADGVVWPVHKRVQGGGDDRAALAAILKGSRFHII